MMDKTASYDLAIFQLIVFIILTPFALFVLVRHGRVGLNGWLFLQAFLLLQLAGAGLTVNAGKHGVSSTGNLLSQVGLSPLLLSMQGVLAEIYRVERKGSFFFQPVASIAFHLVTVSAAALVGVGASSLYSNNPSSNAASEAKGGTLLFLLAWTYLAFLSIKALVCFQTFKHMRVLLIGVIFCMPALALRVAFSIGSFFDRSPSSPFNPVSGSVAARVIMQILPVVYVAAVLVGTGLAAIKAVTIFDQERAEPLVDQELGVHERVQ